MPHNTGFTKAMLWSRYGTRRVLLCGSPQLTHQYTERSRQQGQVSEEGIRWQRSHFCSMHRNLHWGRPEKHEILHRMVDKSITDVYWILWMKWSSLQQHSQANYKMCLTCVPVATGKGLKLEPPSGKRILKGPFIKLFDFVFPRRRGHAAIWV